MKTKVFVSMLLVAFITCTVQAQTVRRVSNALGANAPYSTITSAIAASFDGDIILVEGSPFDYNEAITLTKRLTIKGPGYFLNENTGLQATTYNAYNGATFTFNGGSAGSTMTGMRINTMNINTSDITVSNNWIQNSVFMNTVSSNIAISGNYVGGTIRPFVNITNLLISNNYVGGGIVFFSVVVLGMVSNNIVAGSCTIDNSTIINNIFLLADGFNNTINSTFNSTLKNNVFAAASQPNADGTNVFGATIASLFVGLTGNTSDTQWKLKIGSPAIGAGMGGIDCGMYGGTAPYKISGIMTGQPTITSFTSPVNVPQNGTLNVNVSAKVN